MWKIIMEFWINFIICLSLLNYNRAMSMPPHWATPLLNSTYACEIMNQKKECYFVDRISKYPACDNSMENFASMFYSMIMNRCDISDACRRKGTDYIENNEKFDFIIVGAGVAGPVIARRLADREPWWKILLVEAGPEEPTTTIFPSFAFNTINTPLDWNYKTEPTKPNPTACLETNGVCKWPRGKMMSGTGGMYGMMYIRGHPEIYNRWARAGNPGWSYNEIEHYFERAENPITPGLTSGQVFKRTQSGGPVNIGYFPHKPKFTDDLLNAAAELGYKTSNLHGTNLTGFMVAPMMTDNGQRGTTSKYYLRPIVSKPNLNILLNAHVTKLIKNEWDSTMQGIEIIDKFGVKKFIKADKEIILTAGAIGSPQILLASGIGPKSELERLGIPLHHPLPVGRNLHNHVSVGIDMSIKDPHDPGITYQDVTEYLNNQTGPLTSTGLTQVTAFLESSLAVPGIPDIQVFFDGFSPNCLKITNNIDCQKGKLSSPRCLSRRKIVARPTTLTIKTRGYLTLRSTNPFDPPLIYPNYFTEKDDLNILIEGIKKVIELTETKTMKKWDLKLDTKPVRECSKFNFGSDSYWECVVRMQTGPENHQSGTCKMGPVTDPNAVVDSQLKIHGIRNVRVADASIFPIVPNANPCAAIIMIAEKAADMIMNTWSNL